MINCVDQESVNENRFHSTIKVVDLIVEMQGFCVGADAILGA